MLTIQLAPISERNFYDVIRLQVAPEQVLFVAPNVRSLAECYLYREHNDVFPYAVQVEDEVVGFLLVEVDEAEETFIIWRMMIDKSHQNKGYGRQVIESAIEMARQSGRYRRMIADYVNGNEGMKQLLLSCQFRPTRYREEYDEYEMEYIL